MTRTSAPIGTEKLTGTGYMNVKTGKGETGWELRHKVVIEEKLGRPLQPNERVYHLDGNKLNDEPDNLSIKEVKNSQDPIQKLKVHLQKIEKRQDHLNKEILAIKNELSELEGISQSIDSQS